MDGRFTIKNYAIWSSLSLVCEEMNPMWKEKKNRKKQRRKKGKGPLTETERQRAESIAHSFTLGSVSLQVMGPGLYSPHLTQKRQEPREWPVFCANKSKQTAWAPHKTHKNSSSRGSNPIH